MRQDRTGAALLPSSSDDPREGGGRSGDPAAPKAIFAASVMRGAFALTGAAGSPGLRREGAACRRMTEEGRSRFELQMSRHIVRIDELKRLGPFPQETVDEGGLPSLV